MNACMALLVGLLELAGQEDTPSVDARTRALPRTVTMDDAIRLTERRSPLLDSAKSEIDIARAEEVQAKLLPDPEIDYIGYARLFGTAEAINGQQHQVDFGLPLLVAGQRRARIRSARLQTRTVRAEVCVLRQDVATAAALAWSDLAAAQERIESIEASRAVLEETRRLTETRAARGAQTRLDVLKLAHELSTLDAALEAANADLRAASRDLAVLVGAPRWAPRAQGRLAEVVRSKAPAESWAALAGDLPAVQAAGREVEARDSDVELAKRERWPIPTLRAGTYITTDGDSGSVVFGLSMPLPIFDRGRGELARARARARNARAKERAVRVSAEAELEGSRDVLRARVAAWETIRDGALPNLPDLREMAQEAYFGGASTVLELLDAERTILDTALQGIEVAKAAVDADVLARRSSGHISGSGCD